jgi:uncharacterized protein
VKQNSFLPKAFFSAVVLMAVVFVSSLQAAAAPRFKAVVIAEFSTADQHYQTVVAAKTWCAKLATDSNIVVDFVVDPNSFTDAYLANYKVVIQLNYPPFAWSSTAQAAFQKYIEQGTGGWIGLHHASLYAQNVLGSGQSLFTWFQPLLGGITYQNYVAGLASATVRVEDTNHVCMKGVSKSFTVTNDEWYTWTPNPRTNSNIHVIANVDQTTYNPKRTSDPTMPNNDHPVVWTNTNSLYKGRNIYMFMGHSPDLFANTNFTTLLRNSIFWAAATGTDVKGQGCIGSSLRSSLNLVINTEKQVVTVMVPGAGRFVVTFLDTKGRAILESGSSNGVCRFARNSLSKGVYLLRAEYSGMAISQKVVLE